MHPAARGDLAILHLANRTDTGFAHHFELGVVASVTRTRLPKLLHAVTGDSSRRIPIHQATPGNLLLVPASRLHIEPAVNAIRQQRADQTTGTVPLYESAATLLGDLEPWRSGDPSCLAALRGLAVRHLHEAQDQRCDLCGITTYGNGRINDEAPLPIVTCPTACPVGVDFATNYPVGLEVRVAQGYAAGAIARIERVTDAYPSDRDGTSYYAGRSYVLTLPHWGVRPFPESIVEPMDEAEASRHAVHRPPAEVTPGGTS